MSQYLPTGGFRWDADTAKYTEDYIKQLSDTAARGCMLEVDLEYPQELHDKHDQYPLAPEHVEIKYSMLSEHQKQQASDFGVKPTGEKLCLTLRDKVKYKLHYRNLKQYLNMGLRLKKVHRVLSFNQSPWVQSYIQLNTELRLNAPCKAAEDLPKLMNNSFYGKTCEDVRRYMDVQLYVGVEDVRKLQRKINSPLFERAK